MEQEGDGDIGMKYIILYWSKDDYSDANVLLDKNDKIKMFDDICEAEVEARNNCSRFKIIDFHSYQIGKKNPV